MFYFSFIFILITIVLIRYDTTGYDKISSSSFINQKVAKYNRKKITCKHKIIQKYQQT